MKKYALLCLGLALLATSSAAQSAEDTTNEITKLRAEAYHLLSAEPCGAKPARESSGRKMQEARSVYFHSIAEHLLPLLYQHSRAIRSLGALTAKEKGQIQDAIAQESAALIEGDCPRLLVLYAPSQGVRADSAAIADPEVLPKKPDAPPNSDPGESATLEQRQAQQDTQPTRPAGRTHPAALAQPQTQSARQAKDKTGENPSGPARRQKQNGDSGETNSANQPKLKLSQTDIHFSDKEVGDSAEAVLVLTAIADVQLDGTPQITAQAQTSNDNFRVEMKAEPKCDKPLKANDSCTIKIIFQPSTAGEKKASLEIKLKDDSGTPQTVALAGTGFVNNIASLRGSTEFSATPATRAVLGLDLTGSSSSKTQQKIFLEFNLNVPFGFARRNRDPLSERLWLFLNPRFTSLPRASSPISSLNVQALTELVKENTDIVQGLDLSTGAEIFLIKPRQGISFWSGYKNTHAKLSVALVFGVGITTPFTPFDKNAQEFTINDDIRKTFSIPAADSKGNPSIVAFVNKDRSRFFRKYYTGVRLKTYFFSDQVKGELCEDAVNCAGIYNLFPGIIDVTFGQDEAITGGQLRHWVFRLDAVYPLPFRPSLHIFGSVNTALAKNKTTTPLTLEPPAQVKNLSDPAVFVQALNPPFRDVYRFGAGVDLIELFKKSSTPKNQEPGPAAHAIVEGTVAKVEQKSFSVQPEEGSEVALTLDESTKFEGKKPGDPTKDAKAEDLNKGIKVRVEYKSSNNKKFASRVQFLGGPAIVEGTVAKVEQKSFSVQPDKGAAVELVFDDKTKFEGKAQADLAKDAKVRVEYKTASGNNLAIVIKFLGP